MQQEFGSAKKIEEVEGHPIGLDPVVETVENSVEDVAMVYVIKSLSKKIEERTYAASAIIDRKIHALPTCDAANSVDEDICSTVASLFDFHQTGISHGRYEKQRWKNLQESILPGFIQRWFPSYKNMQNYLAAWGIYYTLKYRDAAVKLLQTFVKTDNPVLPQNELESLIEKITEMFSKFDNDYFLQIWKIVQQNGKEHAYKKYLSI